MKWDFQRSKDRLARERVRIQDAGLNIQRLSREMNLTNLSPTDARIVHGCHIYCHINNFADVIDAPLMQKEDFNAFCTFCGSNNVLRFNRLLTATRFRSRVPSFTAYYTNHMMTILTLLGNQSWRELL